MTTDRRRLVAVRLEDLKVGMFVADVGRVRKHPWPTRSRLIASDGDIELLKAAGAVEVLVDPQRRSGGADVRRSEYGITEDTLREARDSNLSEVVDGIRAETPAGEKPRDIRRVERRKHVRPDAVADRAALAEELPQARQAYQQALNVTREFISDVRAGRKIEVNKVQDSVEGMIESVFRNRDALSALLKLKDYDEYTFTHNLNVTALAVSVGRQMGLDETELLDLGLGAIFHDLGKALIPDEILNKPDRLTEQEFAVMKTHPTLGVRLLEEQGADLSPPVFGVIRHHHERLDGSGYPDGLRESELHHQACICGLADVYDALTSRRVYKPGMPPHEALKVIFKLRDSHFPRARLDRFIQCLGIYPVGTVIRLTTGEVALVMDINHASLQRPRVRVLRTAGGAAPSIALTWDLAEPSMSDREIAGVVDPVRAGVNPADYFDV